MKAIVRLPNITWRDGRPRFNPGPKLRALGFKGEDLRHQNNGVWFTLREAEDWLKTRSEEIAARRAKKASGGRLRPMARPNCYSIEDLFEDLFRAKRFRAKAAKTQKDYRMKAGAFASFEPIFYTVPAKEVTRADVIALHEQLWEQKGLAMANGMMAVLRLAYSEAIDRGRDGLQINPCQRLRLKTPEPRLRCASPTEIAALMAAADEMEPSIGDAIVIALFSGQRQGDVLALSELGAAEGRIRLKQNKTGARVSVLALPMLTQRLAHIKERNKAQGRVTPTIVAYPRTGRAWNEHSFRHRFAEIRFQAQELCPSLEDFRFQDLRDTTVTWLHRAGVDAEGIRSVTGHSRATIMTILNHYLVIDESTNDKAMTALGAWCDKQGVKV